MVNHRNCTVPFQMSLNLHEFDAYSQHNTFKYKIIHPNSIESEKIQKIRDIFYFKNRNYLRVQISLTNHSFAQNFLVRSQIAIVAHTLGIQQAISMFAVSSKFMARRSVVAARAHLFRIVRSVEMSAGYIFLSVLSFRAFIVHHVDFFKLRYQSISRFLVWILELNPGQLQYLSHWDLYMYIKKCIHG